jgi:hypothetical protein
MAQLVYILCFLTSLTCALLLLRAYAQKRTKFLLWSSLCFVCLAVNNILLVIDVLILTEQDFFIVRSVPALAGLCLLLYGLIWESV